MTQMRALDAENRKGTILGLTMAETVLLVLFSMFLALMAMMAKKQQEYAEIEKERAEMEQERDRALAEEHEITQLREDLKLRQLPGESLEDTFTRVYVLEEEFDRNAQEKDRELAEIEQELETTRQEIEILEKENENMRIFYKKQGFGPPPCWMHGGRIVYTFKVKATSDGYYIDRVRNPEHDNRPEAALADEVTTGIVIDERTFREETAPLKKWSDENDCVFFVRIEDGTRVHEKELWKKMLAVVEGHFYKYLVTDSSGDEGTNVPRVLPGNFNDLPKIPACSPQAIERALAEFGSSGGQCVQE